MMFHPKFGTKQDPTVVTSRALDDMPVYSLNAITQRTPCIVDHDFDTDSMTVVPMKKSNWLGAYFGKFGSYEPRIGIVFETGFKHVRIYLYKYTIIIGQVPALPLQAKVTLPDYPDDRLDSRPERQGSGTDAIDSLAYAIQSRPGGGFRLAERIDEGETGTDQAEARPE